MHTHSIQMHTEQLLCCCATRQCWRLHRRTQAPLLALFTRSVLEILVPSTEQVKTWIHTTTYCRELDQHLCVKTSFTGISRGTRRCLWNRDMDTGHILT